MDSAGNPNNSKTTQKAAPTSSMVQQARRRFSLRPMDLSSIRVGMAIPMTAAEETKSEGSQGSGSDDELAGDAEKQSLRQEVEQLKEALRLTTRELSTVNDTVKDLREQQAAKLELEELLEEECHNLQQEVDECRSEGEEMLLDLLDSTSCLDDFKQRLALKEEAFKILKDSYCKLSQEHDKLIDEDCASSRGQSHGGEDILELQGKLDQFQKRARRDSQSQTADIAELHKRLEEVTKERDELEKRNSVLVHQHLNMPRAPSKNTIMFPQKHLNQQDDPHKGPGVSMKRRFSMTSGALDKVLHDAANLLPLFGDGVDVNDNDADIRAPAPVHSIGSQAQSVTTVVEPRKPITLAAVLPQMPKQQGGVSFSRMHRRASLSGLRDKFSLVSIQ